MNLKAVLFLTFVTFLPSGKSHPPLKLEPLEPHYRNILSSSSSLEWISPKYRLNNTFIPSHYDLELLVLLDEDPELGAQFTAPGKVTINAVPTESTSQITLHSYLLQIDSSTILVTNVNQPDQVIEVKGVGNETEGVVQFYTINVDPLLEGGQEYKIYIEFVAPISRDRLDGLYLSTYTDPNTQEEKRLAATQMESIHARKLFPCFDEPELKATFDVKIIRKSNYTALANGELLNSEDDPSRLGWVIDTFNTTVPMSTYLFAMVVSDFECSLADPAIFSKPVQACATPDMIARGGGIYAAEISAQILKFYDDYFQFPYPMEKMDSLSVPQFSAGAMENYGLNLYRESLLVYFPGEDLESSRNQITSVLAHELGHQNFGNLVTMNWWTQIWLNEGFATYVANLGVDAVRPEFKAMEDRIGQLQNSMIADVASNSHPLQNNVPPNNVDSHVGAIIYDKGGSINRMTEKFLTEETFQKGLRYYLQEMQFQPVHSDDLFRNLDKAAAEDAVLQEGLTVKQILDTWTLQRGHPLVKVSRAAANQVYITQEKYAHLDDEQTQLWYVPVTIVTEDKPTIDNNIPELWIAPDTLLTTYTHNTSKWMMINQDATGYYRVLYDNALTSNIHAQLEADASVISPLSKSQLLDDYFTMAFRGDIDIETALNLTTYLAQEDHFTVWNSVFNHLRKTYTLLGAEPLSYDAFKSFLLPRIEPALLKLGIENPDLIGQDVIFRSKLLDWACSMGHPACFEYAQKLFSEWQADPTVNPIFPDVQATMHCAIVASGSQAELDFTLERFVEAAAGSAIKSRLLNALSCTMEPSVINNLIEKALDTESGLSRSNAATVLQRLAMHQPGKEEIFYLLEKRLFEIIENVGEGSPNRAGNILTTLSNYLVTVEGRNRLVTFLAQNSAILNPNDVENSLATVEANIKWMNDFGNDIFEWVKNVSDWD